MVMMPTKRFSLSTTGMESISYLENIKATSSWSSWVWTQMMWVRMMSPTTVSGSARMSSLRPTTPSRWCSLSIT